MKRKFMVEVDIPTTVSVKEIVEFFKETVNSTLPKQKVIVNEYYEDRIGILLKNGSKAKLLDILTTGEIKVKTFDNDITFIKKEDIVGIIRGKHIFKFDKLTEIEKWKND